MSKEGKLVKNTIIVAIGKICTQFISFFLLPLYTSLLSTTEYGTVDLLNTFVTLLIPLLFFQIDQAVFRFLIDIRKNDKIDEKKQLITTTFFTIFIQIIVYSVIFFLISIFIRNEYKVYLYINVIASMLSNLMLQITRGFGDNVIYSIGSLVSGGSTIVLNVLFIAVFRLGAEGMMLANFLANIICAIFIFIKEKLYKFISYKDFSIKELKEMWKYSIPFIPNQLSWWIVTVSDRSIITIILGIALNGIYSAASKFSSITSTLIGIFNITWTESASLYINEKDSSKYFSNIINSAFCFISAACYGIIAFMPFFFKIFIPNIEYANAYYQIPILLISTIFNMLVVSFGSIYVALKKSKEVAKTSIYSAIINIAVNILLIKFIGLYAASISTLISYLVMTIYRYIDVQKYIKIKFDNKKLLVSFIICTILLSIYYIKNLYLCIIGALISIIYAIIYNWTILISFKEKISILRNNYRHKRYENEKK